MAVLSFDIEAYAADGGTQAELDELRRLARNRIWFHLDTPDPKFPGLTVEDDGHLPGRPMEGKLEIGTIFESLTLLVTDEQQKGSVNGSSIFDHLKANNLPVLGPNVGQFLFENQRLIPVKLRGKVALVFWGKVYRDSDGDRRVLFLMWDGKRWVWDRGLVDYDGWVADDCAVMLARKS